MVRNILGVILGYVVMVVIVFVTFTLAYLAMGTEGAFQPGSYEVSTLWMVTCIILGIIASIAGGYICAVVARSKKAPMALAVVVLVLGIILAIPTLSEDYASRDMVRTGEVGNLEAMQSARQPTWIAFFNPLLGAVGVIIGARMRKQPRSAMPTGAPTPTA